MIWKNVHDTYKREMGPSDDLGSGKSRLSQSVYDIIGLRLEGG